MTDENKYRERGVKWSFGEYPLKWTRPKAYVYDCQECGNEFRSDVEIHVPWCPDCRHKEIDRLRAVNQFDHAKYDKDYLRSDK